MLTLNQRAFIIGEEGACPLCSKPVRWSEIDTNWYVCKDCLEPLMQLENPEEQNGYFLGQMDGMGEMLKSVLTTMVRNNEFLDLTRKVIRDIEIENQISLK